MKNNLGYGLIVGWILYGSMAEATVHASVNTGVLDAVLGASPVVQLTLLILVVLSVFCWGVGITKFKEFGDLVSANEKFLNRFYQAPQTFMNWEKLETEMAVYKGSSLAHIFIAGFQELKNASGKSDLMSLERAMRKVTDWEISKMESRLTLLATTGSTGPFIGLFGTVWGIMGSFHKIGATGSASLAVVAPGISEALITTAIGLVTAIPAVVLYNSFVSKIKKHEIAINSFSGDFTNYAKRQNLVECP